MLKWMMALLLLGGQVQAQVTDTTLLVGRTPVRVRIPYGASKGTILVLPGWNFHRDEWCRQTTLCDTAARLGYTLVLPEMGKSVYATGYFPETRADYRERLTLTWMTDTLIPALQQRLRLLVPGGRNYLLGLSTGGRGVALVAERTGRLFRAGVALSGDFDQTLQPADALMVNTYGTMERFPGRWRGEDNPAMNAARLEMPLLLMHGKADKVVPWQHSQRMYDACRKLVSGVKVELRLNETAGHDWPFWRSCTRQVLDWFGQY